MGLAFGRLRQEDCVCGQTGTHGRTLPKGTEQEDDVMTFDSDLPTITPLTFHLRDLFGNKGVLSFTLL